MMCCPGGKTQQQIADIETNTRINKEIRLDKRLREKEMKLLLLGAGESGKSTIAKQMRIIHAAGFPEHECRNYRHIVYDNIFSAIRILIRAVRSLSLQLKPENEDAAQRIHVEGEAAMVHFTGPLTPQHTADLLALWRDPAVQAAFLRGHEFHLSDSTSYYFNAIERIGAADYIPTQQDILRVRAKTVGIVEINFMVDGIRFKMVDVGGQRSERRKWIHCFQDVTAVIFFAALSEYDMKMYEDEVTNRMHDSLKLFAEVCNSEFFRETAMILFLNKKDLFKEKIERVSLSVCFEEYTGPMSYDEGIKFISKRFLAQNQNQDKNIYIHVTCATDTEQVEAVFNAVKDIILRAALYGAGIL
jgi:GTPase SAR1 family protein